MKTQLFRFLRLLALSGRRLRVASFEDAMFLVGCAVERGLVLLRADFMVLFGGLVVFFFAAGALLLAVGVVESFVVDGFEVLGCGAACGVLIAVPSVVAPCSPLKLGGSSGKLGRSPDSGPSRSVCRLVAGD